MDPELPGDIDTYFKRLEEDKAFADELKKYLEPGEAAEEEAPSKTEGRPTGRKTRRVTKAELVQQMEFLQRKRALALTRLRKSRKALRESWQALGETQGKLEEAERKLGEFRSREDQNLARIEDLQDGLEKLRRAYDQHLKITKGLKGVCDKLLESERKKRG